ncbi:MAG: leucine--tRNA ligase [Deltaproteobacteria bacterium CG07_land_8_20_14_0_80_38_7]|nr:MAG: leucine--tRNA ligase [Deltaproteobacteria bacterium CG07_land_8_20_14_0_80_38_7]
MTEENRYEPKNIEKKWQDRWDKAKIFNATEDSQKQKFYLLEMLPYPSGLIHMGHVRNYVIGDVVARYKTMQGFNVLHPMGWDAFGLPAENAAIDRGIHPAKWTKSNIDYMRGQLKNIGTSYDWTREFATCDPSYYKWEQLIFTKMFEKGMAYKRTSMVNWCPKCNTVLANEQVEDGNCWRCSSIVKQQKMSQWFFKITEYAEELLKDVDDKLQGWPERVKIMQREWIGKSSGAMINFEIAERKEKIEIFTTRPDTLYGATFMSLSCEHPLVKILTNGTEYQNKVDKFIEKTSKIDHTARLEGRYEKDGVFTGAYCINPVTNDKMPIYVANFVLAEYGTGAVMAVPTHDQRDFEFAKKYNLPLKVVIHPKDSSLDERTMDKAFEDEGVLTNSAQFTGMMSCDAIDKITEFLEQKGIGKKAINYKLKDWCLSRQRYWGTPIPVIYCEKCGTLPVPEEDLPVILPENAQFTGEGGSPLAKVESFVNVKCPKCKAKAKRETDTMDTFVESSWYMFRYACSDYTKGPLDKGKTEYWLPVDQYIGGIEHAVGHLMYCRFFTKVLRDLKIVDIDEPVLNLLTQGMVIKDGFKMSKSKGNIVTCDSMIEKYGADTVRLFSLFAAPPEKDLDWNDQGIEGMHRFLFRIWRLIDVWKQESHEEKASDELLRFQHKTIKKVSEDLNRYHFNTAISAIMEYVNFLYQIDTKQITKEAIETLILVLAPLVPHISDEIWESIGNNGFTVQEKWLVYNSEYLKEDTIKIAVQVNGKLRDAMSVNADSSDDEIKKLAQQTDKVAVYISGKEIKKIIYVPKKLVNIVV